MPSSSAILAVVVLAAVAVVGIAALSFWHWRQSKVDLVALEARLQAERAQAAGRRPTGLSDPELREQAELQPGALRKWTSDPFFVPPSKGPRGD